MSRLRQALQRVFGATATPGTLRSRTIDTNFSIIKGNCAATRLPNLGLTKCAEGDRVILHGKQPSLSKALKRGEKLQTPRGAVEHDSIIGKRVWDTVQSRKGLNLRVSLPTLEEYVALTPRLVTPDANLIASLLDIHVNTPAAGETQPTLEILESGTGHGSLTLHLARAIHAANTTPPPRPLRTQINYLEGRITRPNEKDTEQIGEKPTEQIADSAQEEWDAWRAQRNAIIHTVDVSPKFAALAEKNIRGFRRGIYAGNIDFYVGPVENWIAQQKQQREKTGLASLTGGNPVDPFLSHVILDMPSSNLRIPHVTPMLKRDGLLVVFMPSITQIGECLQLIRDQRLPLVQEKVIELGSGISGGRTWDVRFATKKSGADPASWAAPADAEGATPVEADEQSTASEVPTTEEPPKEGESVLVCRPKVGVRIQGGGFVAVWRRIEDR
ncbi:tRNA (adenine(58)-N(1))-methyltransferase catalytic subunit GCD14 [Penicillium robsamsonii]|uniref:tRNA (adenine(58)-N(1))-methyltransferase catalytic subunit GCD14 n=1 Tax=Penicillium robsamsonii TaxID=1792511 RepID=UPI002548FF8F|nr:tRNA (adenine(58)-N(1))-methyltransferase catalytic subunit GCD14 [Penicillium robsamsonii]KAJ5823535.1 tRNA (adenine(58)-N(1))-methyltransferase catalytic subunit GCD14 [Penicillium robsamsonii]